MTFLLIYMAIATLTLVLGGDKLREILDPCDICPRRHRCSGQDQVADTCEEAEQAEIDSDEAEIESDDLLPGEHGVDDTRDIP